ncbi:endonuclease III-like protein 1 [Onthophagus taurus]|uniref:endonuclease III-like protein 1 n=1 Tax=Onthophagus taurus TaxID=166361 RepID=UPI0039BE46D7
MTFLQNFKYIKFLRSSLWLNQHIINNFDMPKRKTTKNVKSVPKQPQNIPKEELKESCKENESLSSFKKEKPPSLSHKRDHVKVEYEEVPKKILKYEGIGPGNWEVVLDNLREMRMNKDAPVDSMGCDQCPDTTADPKDKRYQALLSLMLSSQTKDEVTYAAMLRLREHGCTLEKISEITEQKLSELLYPVSFYKNKAKYIKKSTQMIKDVFNGDIPKTVEELCKLPGVGPKMAHLCMKTAWNEITGIGVDTHVHRITNRLGWVKTKTPEETRKGLEGWLPKELWSEVNHLLVGFGQQTCKPVKPLCESCLNKDLCPFVKKNTKKSAK